MSTVQYNLKQQAALDEFRELETAEDRLTYLFERQSIAAELPGSSRTDDCKVPGCLSGLWVRGYIDNGVCSFQCFSDSKMVHGVAAFVCDLLGERSAQELLAIDPSYFRTLGIEQLLSLNRRQAVSRIVEWARHFAREATVRQNTSEATTERAA